MCTRRIIPFAGDGKDPQEAAPGRCLHFTRAPPSAALKGGLVGTEDYIHRGFEAFDEYLARTNPRYWLHGHLSHRYTQQVGETKVIGVSNGQPMTLEFA
jgi:hypothetical protein